MKLNDSVRKDISIALTVWKELLNEFLPDGIEYIFTKGSSSKPWETDIDYVPLISDVDIHIKLYNNKKKLLSTTNGFNQAVFFTTNYEKWFSTECKRINHKKIHLPRVQIVQIESHGRKGYVVPPRNKDIIWIQGSFPFPEEMDHNKLRDMDKKSLLQEKPFIDSIPDIFFEQSGFDYYTLLYRLCSRMSPCPIRLLTQVLPDNPHDIWALNKSSIFKLLQKNGFTTIAENFEQFYLNGWRLFESSFMDMNVFRMMIKNGYFLLTSCYEELLKL